MAPRKVARRSRNSRWSVDRVERRIYLIRGQRIILDADLAQVYGVTTARLNQQVRRNLRRFPPDFIYPLTRQDLEFLRAQVAASPVAGPAAQPEVSPNLKLQNATSRSWGGRRKLPLAFTEHGAIMAATVLNSPQAVKASVFVVRAFVKLREILSTHRELSARLNELENKLQNHDDQIHALIEAIRELMCPPEEPPKPQIGFHTELAARSSAVRKRRLAITKG